MAQVDDSLPRENHSGAEVEEVQERNATSKIELTEEQTERLRRVWLFESTHAKALVAVANELVAMGLVRPANDDLAARVAALEAKVNGKQWDKAPDTYDEEAARGIAAAHNTPDPHAAARVRLEKAEGEAEGER